MQGCGDLALVTPRMCSQDLCFGKIIGKCSSMVIVCQAHATKKHTAGGATNFYLLGDLTQEQMNARQTHLLPLDVQKSIAYLRIWV